MKLLLFISSSLLTLLLVVHAVRTRGARTALAFFVSAFLFGVIRGNSVAYLAAGEDAGPYIFSEAIVSIGRAELPAVIGWIFSVYLSWVLAERFLRSRPALAGGVFTLSAFAMLAMGCFSDAVETTASGVGWWRWNIVVVTTPLLPAGTHLFGIIEWMSVGFDFLVPFLLFRTPKGARSPLAWASLLLYPIHWACHWRFAIGPGVPHAYEWYHALIAFAVPVFALLPAPRLADGPRPASAGIERLPAVALGGMFVVLIAVDLGMLHSGELLVSLLPLAVMAAGAAFGEKAAFASGVAGAALAFAGSLAFGRSVPVALARMVPVLLAPACLLVFGSWLPRRRDRRVRWATATVLVLAAAGTGWGMARGKREREELSLLVAQAQSAMAARDFTRAEAAAKQAVALKPNVSLSTKMLANLYGGSGRLSEAWEYAQRSLELNPADYEAQRLAGQILRGQGDCDKATPYYQRALMLNPGDIDSAAALADCFSRQRRYGDAIAALQQVLARQPEAADLQHLLGALLIQTGDFRSAARVVGTLLAAHPEDAGAHLLMAYIHAAAGNAAAARSEAEKTLQLDPSDSQARALLDSLPR
ncbi:MAG TPA: tetratricopeptide repeat protein [Candidatus Polarisedimenticolia bacterium]|nr:tetratricopeptide repeat protein [Candidatus Polarisedimenticolia bacterium]